MKEYTLIYFNEDGGCVISFETKEEINILLKELSEENGIDNILTKLETFDSMYSNEHQKYMIIKGLPVAPKIVEKITKIEI